MSFSEKWRKTFTQYRLLSDGEWAIVLASFSYDVQAHPPDREQYAVTPDNKVCVIAENLYSYYLEHATHALFGEREP